MARTKFWGEHDGNGFPHVILSQQFSREDLEKLCDLSLIVEKEINEKKMVDWLDKNIISILFFEPSTRTYFSFWRAALSLGARVMASENAGEFSSNAKGEALRDMARIMSDKSDALIIRHPDIGSASEFAKFSSVPVINGGDGPGQHPTQALLDLLTILKIFGRIDGLKIALVGDLLYGRTVRSLCYLLSKFEGVEIYFVSPEAIRMKQDIKDHLDENNIIWHEETDLKPVAKKVDVIYQTRIQKERFPDIEEYKKVSGIYIINKEILSVMKEKSGILHPLPRINEIRYHVDRDQRSHYFEQALNGDYIRMALLLCMLNPETAEFLLRHKYPVS